MADNTWINIVRDNFAQSTRISASDFWSELF